ncbi:MAG: hypothetical protein ABFD60_02910 [Bryobacteraceae bacterium]
MTIHGFTISAFGHCASKQTYDSAKLSRDAVNYLTSLIDSNGNDFNLSVPMKDVGQVKLQWTSEHLSWALASIINGDELLSTLVMVSGIHREADQHALEIAQSALEDVCKAAGETARDDLLQITDRPAVVTIRWSTSERRTQDLLSDMEACLAAAFLERAFEAGRMAL